MIFFIFHFFIVWRIFLFLAAYTGSFILPFQPRFPYADTLLIPSGLPAWLWSFANFDGVHYLTISRYGYSAQFTQVFFPLYPLLLGLVNKILFFLPRLFSGLMVTNLFFLSALFVFYRLMRMDFNVRQIRWMIVFLLFFPLSLYFGSLYTESLFLLLLLSAFYFARRRHWLAASVVAALAGSTRLVGIFLLPALLWEWYLQSNNKKVSLLLSVTRSPVTYVVPLGLLVYMVYLQINFGDPLYFWHAQPVFGAERSGSSIVLLPQVLWRYLKIFKTVPKNSLTFWIPFTELVSFFLAAVFLIIAHLKKIRFSYLLFSWPALIVPSLTGTLSSMPRYVLILFPIFPILGLIASSKIKLTILAFFVILFACYTILFTRGLWVS